MDFLAASGIILKENKILLLQRSNYSKSYPNFWGCPGGRTEEGETPQQNAIREVKEECGLDFFPSKIIKIGVWQNKKFYRFLGTWKGKIKIQEEEVKAYGWFTFQEAIKLNLSFDYREIIEILHQKKLL